MDGGAPLLERCFLFDAVEDAYPVRGIEGEIPPWLRGAYYVNGPARFERAGQRYNHWLDGDGMVHAATFSDLGVQVSSRFIRTKKLRDEEAAGRFLYRAFGTAFPGDRLRREVMLESPVNVSVYPFAGRMLASGEQSIPLELDPVTLETRGEYDFEGAVNELTPFSAHPKIDPASGNLLNFGLSFAAAGPTLNIYEFDAAGQQIRRRRHPLQHRHSVHDFGFTAGYTVFYLSPLLMNFSRFHKENLSVMDSLSWEPEKGSRLVLAPRGKAGEVLSVPVAPRYCLHFIGCFERDGCVVVDVMELERPVYSAYAPIPDLFRDEPAGQPVRYVIECASGRLLQRIAIDCAWSPDFPSIDSALAGREYNDFHALGISAGGQPGRKFFDRVFRGSWRDGAIVDSFQVPAGEYLSGEPVCVVNPANAGDRVAIVQHLQPANEPGESRAWLLLFDGMALSAGPLAKLPLRHFIHPGFHAVFVPAAQPGMKPTLKEDAI